MESNTDVRITSIVSQQAFLEMDELEKSWKDRFCYHVN